VRESAIGWRIGASTVALGLVLAGSPVLAQDGEEENSGDIVVTANRVESLASKTPIALTAVTGEDLTASAITNPTQLDEFVPNVSIVRGLGLQITIRGVTSTDSTEKGDPSAAFLLNGVYLARPQAQEVSFFDIQRVEVLRGPQGTLYGRNTTAGVINVISHRPEFDLGGSIDASYESFDHLNLTGVFNVPVSNTLAIRAAANFDRHDSYVVNASGDGFSYDPFKENTSLRLSALWEPTSALSLLLVGDYSELKGTRINGVQSRNFFTGAAPLTDPAATEPVRPTYFDSSARAQRTNVNPQQWDPVNDDSEKGAMGELNWDVGPVTLTYLGSYHESVRRSHSTIIAGMNRATFDGDYWQTSHEVRLAFGGDGPLQAQVGGYYFKEKSGIAFFILDPQNIGFPPFATQFGFPQDPTISENKSVFGQATYEVLPELRFTAGLRYSHDAKSRVGATVFDTDPAAGIPGNRVVLQVNDAARTFDKITWRFGLDYDSPLGLIYASVSSGYKAGGFNDGCLAGPDAPPQCVYSEAELFYDPETLTAYEAGFKLNLADRLVGLNGSIFHYEYKGLQLSQLGDFGGCGFCQLTSNAAAATVDGVELQALVRPASGLVLDFGLNWLHARYADYNPSRVVNGTPITLDFSGHPLARSPKWTGSAGATYTFGLATGGSVVANARTRFSSRYYLTDIANLIDYYQPSYTKTDASLTYSAPGDRYYIGAYVENIENKIVLTGAGFGNFGLDGTAAFADPRRYGIRAGVRF
jgi:iron complex outermembrane receptor protein